MHRRPGSGGRARRSGREAADGASRCDEGSAVADFVLVSVLVLALLMVVLQVGLVLQMRNVLVAAASEGARYGANVDRTPAQGGQRAVDVVAQALSAGVASRLAMTTATPLSGEGLRTVEVTLTSPVPVPFLPVHPLSITVHGHALREGP